MAKKDKKKKKDKLPKEIAGVKIPKGLRDQGEQLVKLAKNPLVAEVAAAGLVAVAAALREGRKSGAKPAEEARPASPGPAPEPADVKNGLADLANLALAAATTGLQALAAARDKGEVPPRKPKGPETAH